MEREYLFENQTVNFGSLVNLIWECSNKAKVNIHEIETVHDKRGNI